MFCYNNVIIWYISQLAVIVLMRSSLIEIQKGESNMRITPNHIAIGRIFEQNFLFEVPKYQRYYAWEDEQVNDFIKDLDNILNSTLTEPVEHFLVVLCVHPKQ